MPARVLCLWKQREIEGSTQNSILGMIDARRMHDGCTTDARRKHKHGVMRRVREVIRRGVSDTIITL